MLLSGSAALLALPPGWDPRVVAGFDPEAAGLSTEDARSGARGFSGLLGGEGDLDLDIQDLLAKSAKDSTVLDLSKGFTAKLSSGAPAATFCCCGLTSFFGRCSATARTLGADFELGSHETGRSIIDLLLLRVCLSTAVTPAAALCSLSLCCSFSVWWFPLTLLMMFLLVTSLSWNSIPTVVSFAVAGLRRRVSVVVVKLKDFSNSVTRSKDGMSKVARPGRLLKPGDRPTGTVASKVSKVVQEEGGGLDKAPVLPATASKSGAECEP